MADQATIARPYARAAFDYAREAGKLAAWGEVLARASALLADDRVKALVGNPQVARTELVGLIVDISGAKTDAEAQNFLRLLADNARLLLLPEIAAQYAASRAEFENTVDVTVTSAMALTEEQSAKLSKALTQRLKRTVRLVNEIDPALIGGAVVRAGDFVIDGSLRGRVERLGNIMKTVF